MKVSHAERGKMNKVIFMGRLTRNPEVRYSQSENSMAIASFSIAVDRKFKRQGEPEADFFNCTAFGKQAEFIEKYLKQGTKILLTGRLQNNNYTNKDGQKVYQVVVVVEEVEFAESKGSQQTESVPQQQSVVDNGFMNIPIGIEEELPFS